MRDRVVIGCRSDALAAELEGDIVLHLASGQQTLKAGDDKGRHQLITSIRGNTHAELDVLATTFRQKDGTSNRRYLRHKTDALEALAGSFAGMPVLLDHRSYSQSARIGTIRTSELHTHGGTGWSSFKMGLRVVKPEAVISVLDGTIDRFSIGWSATGPVLCSVHKTDVRSSGRCGCWPGDVVEHEGVSRIVEFEFQSAEGTEVSAVNVPAVKGTKVEDVRAALAAELHLSLPPTKETSMLTRLAAAMGLATLTAAEEDRAVAAYEEQRRGRLAAEQERDQLRESEKTLKAQLAVAKTAGIKVAVDAALDAAYRDGKLRYGRDDAGAATPSRFEPMLRKLAASEGIDALRAELDAMPKVVPVGERPLDKTPAPEGGPSLGAGDGLTADELTVCRELGIEPKEFLATKREMQGGV